MKQPRIQHRVLIRLPTHQQTRFNLKSAGGEQVVRRIQVKCVHDTRSGHERPVYADRLIAEQLGDIAGKLAQAGGGVVFRTKRTFWSSSVCEVPLEGKEPTSAAFGESHWDRWSQTPFGSGGRETIVR